MAKGGKVKINFSNGLSSSWIYIFCFQSPSEAKLRITLDVRERVTGSIPCFSTDLYELCESMYLRELLSKEFKFS